MRHVGHLPRVWTFQTSQWLGYRLHDQESGLDYIQRQIIFFCTASWSALCPTQLPILSAALDHFPELPGIKTEQSITSRVYVDDTWKCVSTSSHRFMYWCLLDLSLGNKSGGRTDLAFDVFQNSWLCRTVISIWQYCIMANYSWILMEGLYLHNLIFLALFSDTSSITLYVVLGWGK